MLLADKELRALLPKMAFETDDHRLPFKPDEQIQPCSIDLRLDPCFWVPQRARWCRALDLRNLTQGELAMKRLFFSRRLQSREGFTLQPGQMILGRTFEKFTIPVGYAGKIEGRSTFARLGLSVHCTGDFINPGWRGRMPLQLVNHGVAPLVITPHLPVCQLMLVQTSSESQRPYPNNELGHKYMHDEGEPSRYFQDMMIRRLHESRSRYSLPEEVTKQFVEAVGSKDSAAIDRFLNFLDKLPHNQITNAREVLERFAERDTWSMTWANRWLSFRRWISLLPPSTALGLLIPPYGYIHYIVWIVSGILMPVGIHAMFFAREPDQPFTRQDVEDYFRSSGR
jgi:deoxycytidine triphosphate deaminase